MKRASFLQLKSNLLSCGYTEKNLINDMIFENIFTNDCKKSEFIIGDVLYLIHTIQTPLTVSLDIIIPQ